ncbi:MAG: response regulator, partial [Candidatus Sericytochromatia bacterium]
DMDALKLLNIEKFDVVISDIKMPDLNGFEIMIWMKRNNISSKLIIVSSTINDLMRKNYGKYDVIQILKKPIDIQNLIEVIDDSLKDDFKADITDINTFDLVRILLMTHKDKLLVIKSEISQNIGKVYVKNGEVIHAEYKDLKGLDAFYKIMSIQNGSFEELEWEEPENRTINYPADFLMMESARVIDEFFSKNSNNDLSNIDQEQIKVLIFNNSSESLEQLSSSLVKDGYFVDIKNSTSDILDSLSNNEYNFFISDINLPNFNAFKVLKSIKSKNNLLRLIMLADFESQEYKNLSMDRRAIKYFEKPINTKLIEKFLTRGIQGTLNEVTLLDFIQLALNSSQESLIEVYSPLRDLSGKIYIEKGSIIHAEYDNLTGEEAFYGIVKINRGIFTELDWESPEKRTINKPSITLLMKVARVLEDLKNENEKTFDKLGENVDKKITSLSEKEQKSNLEESNDTHTVQVPEIVLQNMVQTKYINPTELFFLERERLFMPLECLKYIIPSLTKTGYEHLISTETDIEIKKFITYIDGKRSFDFIYKNYYRNTPLDEFMNMFLPSNHFIFEKDYTMPKYINFDIKLGEILSYMKVLSMDTLNRMLEIQTLSSTSVGIQKPLGELLSQLSIVEDEKVKIALNFQNMFKKYISIWINK